MATNEKKNKHMTLDDRIEIQECLCKGMTFKSIGKRIGKCQTTTSREVKQHMQPYIIGYVRTEDAFPHLLKAPFVCNGCEKKSRSSCPYRRQIYSAKHAQASYESLRTDSRSGIPLNKESFYETERIISTAVRNAQHVYHAIQANDLPVSTATFYRRMHWRGFGTYLLSIDLALRISERSARRVW